MTDWFGRQTGKVISVSGGGGGTSSQQYLSLTGGTMSGQINMSTYRIIGLPLALVDAPSDGDAVSKKILVDTAFGVQSNCLLKAIDTMNGQINMNSNKIINLTDPTNGQDASSKHYIDSALTGYLSKFGTTAQGDIMLSIAADTVRNLGCSNINAGKRFNLFFGDNSNYLSYTPGLLIINSSDGIDYRCNGNDIMSMGLSSTNLNGYIHRDLDMGTNKILKLENPTLAQDATTKNYVDNRLVKNTSGAIGILGTDYNNRIGAVVTRSQDYDAQYRAYNIFTQGLANGLNEFATVTSPTYPVIVQIQLLTPIALWQVALRGRIGASSAFTAWQVRGSVDGVTYTTLINSTQILASGNGSSTPIYLIPVSPVNTTAFKYFQLYFTAANGTSNPGLSHCQLYQYDSLY